MLSKLREFIKSRTYTLRFSILSIFVIFLSISMLSLIGLMYIKATTNITTFAFDMMKQISSRILHDINQDFTNIELENKSAADIIESGVVDLNASNNEEMLKYANIILHDEGPLLHILKKFAWVDKNNNVVLASKDPNGSITLELVYHANNKIHHHYIYQHPTGKVFKIVDHPEAVINFTIRPWYSAAIKNKKTTWVDVYKYYFSRELGISVATPVISEHGDILGVIKFDISLEFLRKLVEDARFSKNGVVFIVTQSNNLIAFPHIIQDKNNVIMNIHQLPNHPWVIASYDYFKKTGKLNFMIDYNHNQYLVSYNLLAQLGDNKWYLGIAAPRDDYIYSLRNTRQMGMLIGFVMLIFSIFIVSAIISRIVKPMKKITREIDKIKNFELTHTPKIASRIREVNAIASALHAMKKGLRSFQKYIPSSLVRDLIEAGDEAKTGGEKKSLAILFTDIHNFTAIAETSDPQLLAIHICDYFDVLTSIIIKQSGTIDKYIGDSVMAFWGAPLDVEQPCHKAAKAALLCMRELDILNGIWRSENKPIFHTSIGINFGEAVVGHFGSRERLSYTAFGDAVNLASRLQDINHYFDTKILVSEHVYNIIKDQFILRMIDCVNVKGKGEAINIYELIGENHQKINYDIAAYKIAFEKAFSAYKNRQWDEAIIHFKECMVIYKNDGVSPLFITRCEQYKLNPPSENWRGAWHLDKKPV